MRHLFAQQARFLLIVVLLLAASVASAGGPFQFYPVTPCRVVDTRWPNAVNGGPALPPNLTRPFRVQGNCSVPVGAKAAALNVTVVTPGSGGWLGVYPVGGFTGSSTINFIAGEFAIANGAVVPLSPVAFSSDNDISAFWQNYAGIGVTLHLVLDVTGYFR